MKNAQRAAMLETIRSNIETSGRHIYSVLGGESPRYLYTIGLSKKTGFELVLAGLPTLPTKAAARLLNTISKQLEGGKSVKKMVLDFQKFGRFSLAPVDSSWTTRMMLGALDYYECSDMKVMQVVPETKRMTIDVPTMADPYDASKENVWKWLDGGWPYEIQADSVAITNLDALQGYAISEVVRWEEEEWEMFSGPGPEVPTEQIVRVPIATLVAFDASLETVLDLGVGKGMHREYDEDGKEGPWEDWVSK